jgi:PBP1b-binding outer membrane lipoprotein LpoB
MKQLFTIIILSMILTDCSNQPANKSATEKGSFGYDLAFLKKHDSVIVLANGDAQLIVSAKYQAKVFTFTN